MKLNHKRLVGVGVIILAFLTDQVTKMMALQALSPPGTRIEVTPFFNLSLAFNRGISFGLLSQDTSLGRWLLSLVILGVCGLMTYWFFQSRRWLSLMGFSLILGGALGNLVDRLTLGHVVDFLDFHWMGHHFPTFNGADTWVSMGALLILIETFFLKKDEDRP